jgi:hypothetical protein
MHHLLRPSDRRARLAGYKRWAVPGGQRAILYTARGLLLPQPRSSNGSAQWASAGQVANPIGVVPMVPMLNLPNMLGGGMSDLQAVLALQDAINKLLADMLVNSEFVAYPQRYATGLEIPTDPATGRPLDREAFLSSVSRLWVNEDPNGKFGQLEGSDGLGYVRQIEALVQHIAAQTRTPPHYLLGQSGAFPSGESLKATETGLVAKVRRKQVSATASRGRRPCAWPSATAVTPSAPRPWTWRPSGPTPSRAARASWWTRW